MPSFLLDVYQELLDVELEPSLLHREAGEILLGSAQP